MSELALVRKESVKKTGVVERSLAKGILAGLVGGLAATAAKTLAERLYPQKTQGETEPPVLQAEKLAGLRGTAAKEAAMHWGFGGLVGAAYGGVAEFYPAATAKEGASFGLALATLTHETLPGMGLGGDPKRQTALEHTSEMASHVVYGLVTETVRRTVRKMLG